MAEICTAIRNVKKNTDRLRGDNYYYCSKERDREMIKLINIHIILYYTTGWRILHTFLNIFICKKRYLRKPMAPWR